MTHTKGGMGEKKSLKKKTTMQLTKSYPGKGGLPNLQKKKKLGQGGRTILTLPCFN